MNIEAIVYISVCIITLSILKYSMWQEEKRTKEIEKKLQELEKILKERSI